MTNAEIEKLSQRLARVIGDLLLAPSSLKKVKRRVIGDIEGAVIRASLEANRWNRKATARALGISYRCLLYKIPAATKDQP